MEFFLKVLIFSFCFDSGELILVLVQYGRLVLQSNLLFFVNASLSYNRTPIADSTSGLRD